MFRVTEDFPTFIRRYPITTVILGICTVLMIITTFMGGYNINTVAQLGGYDKQLVHRGQIWRLLTYAFGHAFYNLGFDMKKGKRVSPSPSHLYSALVHHFNFDFGRSLFALYIFNTNRATLSTWAVCGNISIG